MTNLDNLTTLKDFAKSIDMDYMYIYNRVKNMDVFIHKINPRLFLYDRQELESIFKK